MPGCGHVLHGDSVVLDDSSAGVSPITVTLNATVLPNSVTVNSTKDYTLSGSGSIGGATALTKANSGQLTLTGNHTFTGGITVTGGTLSIGGAGQLGGGTYSGNIVMGTGAVFHLASSANHVLQTGVIGGGGTLNKDGIGTLTLSGTANTYSGGTVVNGGRLNIAADRSLGAVPGAFISSNIAMDNSATLNLLADFALSGNRGITLGSNGVQTISGTGGTSLSPLPPITGAGSVNLNFTGECRLRNANTHTGNTRILGAMCCQAGAENAFQFSTITANTSGASIWQNTITSATLGGISGNFNLPLDVRYGGNLVIAVSVGNNNKDTVFGGVLSGAGSLRKIGSGKLTLNGTNTYAGPTTVSSGTLALGASGSINGSSSITLAPGAVLDTTAIGSYVMPASPKTFTFHLDGTNAGSSGRIVAAGLDVTTAAVVLTVDNPLNDAAYILADYTSLNGSQFASVNPPDGYTINYAYNGGTQIALVIASSSNYAIWASQHAGSADAPANGDYNNDGLQNGIAFFMGMDALATNPGVSNGSLTWPYRNGVTAYKVQISTDLSPEGWTDVAANDPNLHATDPGPSGSVTYALPVGVAGGRIFARLVVTP